MFFAKNASFFFPFKNKAVVSKAKFQHTWDHIRGSTFQLLSERRFIPSFHRQFAAEKSGVFPTHKFGGQKRSVFDDLFFFFLFLDSSTDSEAESDDIYNDI